MSMEMRVFFRGDLPDTAALNQALKELGFPQVIAPLNGPLAQHSGFLPMKWQDEDSGVEFYLDDGRDEIEEAVIPERLGEVDPSFDRTVSFRYFGHWDELLCATCGAAALAKLVGGVVYEEQDGVLWPVDQAIVEARKTIENVAEEIAKERGA